VSDAFEPFIEAKWNRIHTVGNNAGPSFIQGTFGQFDVRERVRLDDPFLTPAARTTIANAILASGCNTSLTASCLGARSTFGGQGIGGPLNAADIAAINAVTYRFVDARNLLMPEFVTRISSARRTASSLVPAAPSTRTGATNSRPTTASSTRTTTRSATSTANASCWRLIPAEIRRPGRSSAAHSSIRPRPLRLPVRTLTWRRTSRPAFLTIRSVPVRTTQLQ